MLDQIAADKPDLLLPRIKWARPYLNPALRRIAEYILKNPEITKASSIKDLAIACEVSEATITRFVKSLQVPSFQQLKIKIAEELSQNAASRAPSVSTDQLVYEDITASDNTNAVLDKIAGRYIETIRDTRESLSAQEVDRAVEAIEKCELMAFFALGSSIIAIENALMRFMRVGKQCQFFRDFSVRQISTATLNERSLAIGISNSGRTITTAESLKEAKRRGATTICITSFPDSPVADYADIKLFTPTVTAASGSAAQHESMVSKIAQLYVIDVLYSCFAVRNYEQSVDALERTDIYSTSSRF